MAKTIEGAKSVDTGMPPTGRETQAVWVDIRQDERVKEWTECYFVGAGH